MNENKWIYVGMEHKVQTMPKKDCKVWIARGSMGNGWIQEIDYYARNGRFDWDGIYAYQIVEEGITPEPYIMKFAGNKTVICEKII